MARTAFPLVAYSPAGGAVGTPQSIDSTNGMQVPLENPFVPANIDRFGGVYLVVYNSAAAPYNVIVRGNVTSGYLAADLTTAVANGAVVVIGPLSPLVYGNPIGDGRRGLWVDFSNTLFTGTIMPVVGMQQVIPANVAQTAALKMSPGTLLGAVVQTLGTAAWNAYDDSMAANGGAIATFAGSAAVGSMLAPARPTARGIVSASIASGPALTVWYA